MYFGPLRASAITMSEFSVFEREPQPTAVVRAIIPASQIPAFLGRAYGQVMQALRVHDIAPVGPPFAYYLGMPTTTVEMEAGFPVASPCGEYGDVVPSKPRWDGTDASRWSVSAK